MITLGLAAWIVLGSLLANVATIDPPDLKLREPIPVPAEYGFRRDDSDQDSARVYRSRPIPPKTADTVVAEVVDYYVSGLAPEWRVLDRTEDRRSDTPVVRAKFRQGETSNGIGIDVYALVSAEDRSAVVILMIQALNCGEDVPGLPSGEVCWQGPV